MAIVVDATGLVLGRLASVTANRLLAGEEIYIINAEKVLITGSPDNIYDKYLARRHRGTKERGPYYPRRPEMILLRTVRGMLPYKLKRGRNAMSRLRVYIGVPRELKDRQFEQPEAARMRESNTINFIELGDLSKRLGSNF
jgi:large subunit ribosomal protein L13